jgi:hypothetical protein
MQRAPSIRRALCAATILATIAGAGVARGQSLDDLELRKRGASPRVAFGMMALYETAVGLNRERPELTSYLLLAPQLKIGEKLRLRLNVGVLGSWLARQENPWDLTDFSLQLTHLGLVTIPRTGILLSGNLRWYFPTSKESREAGLLGQARLTAKLSRTLLGRLYLALEWNVQKYFHRWTTPSLEPGPGSDGWLHSAGRDEVVDNSSSWGLGETLTATVTTLPGLDLSAIWGLYQSRRYQPDAGHPEAAGSSLVAEPRRTGWEHSFRLVLDASYGLGALPFLRPGTRAASVLGRSFVSLGYACLAPQLQNGGATRSLNPFNPKYAQAYLDLMFVY